MTVFAYFLSTTHMVIIAIITAVNINTYRADIATVIVQILSCYMIALHVPITMISSRSF